MTVENECYLSLTCQRINPDLFNTKHSLRNIMLENMFLKLYAEKVVIDLTLTYF